MIKHLKAFYHQTLLTRLNVIAAFAHKRVKENTSKGRAAEQSLDAGGTVRSPIKVYCFLHINPSVEYCRRRTKDRL